MRHQQTMAAINASSAITKPPPPPAASKRGRLLPDAELGAKVGAAGSGEGGGSSDGGSGDAMSVESGGGGGGDGGTGRVLSSALTDSTVTARAAVERNVDALLGEAKRCVSSVETAWAEAASARLMVKSSITEAGLTLRSTAPTDTLRVVAILLMSASRTVCV